MNNKKGITPRTLEIRKAIIQLSQNPIELAEIMAVNSYGLKYESFYQQYHLMKKEGVIECTGFNSYGRSRKIIVHALVDEYKEEHWQDPNTHRNENAPVVKVESKDQIKRKGHITKVTAGSYHTGQGKRKSPPNYIASTMAMF